MSYSPAPLALDRTKPAPWNVEGAFVAPEYQGLWRRPGFVIPLWEASGAPLDVATRRVADAASGTWQPKSLGVGYDLAATSQHLWWDAHPIYELGGDVEFTIWVTVDVASSDGDFPALLSHRTSFGDGIWELYWNNIPGGDRTIDFAFRTGGSLQSVGWAFAWPTGTGLHTFVVTRRRGGTYELWIDGVSEGTQTNTTNLQAAPHRLAVGNLQAGSTSQGQVLGTYLSAGLLRDVTVTDRAAKQFSADPHALFRPNWDYVTAGGQNVAVGQVVEAEAANTITPLLDREVAVGQVSEAETANAITPVLDREVAVGQATEAETANPIVPVLDRAIDVGQASEAESANPVTPLIDRDIAVGQASEAETANAIIPSTARNVAVGQATEAELARAITPSQPINVPVMTAVERELARVMTPSLAGVGAIEVTCQILSPSASGETLSPSATPAIL